MVGGHLVSYFSLHPQCLANGRHLGNVSCVNKLKKQTYYGKFKCRSREWSNESDRTHYPASALSSEATLSYLALWASLL